MENKNYTESFYYQIQLTARYLNVLASELFEKIDSGISFDEFIALANISKDENMCMRDLAKLLLKDRASAGRITNILYDKKLIDIKADTKNNRLIKKLSITKKGEELIKAVTEKLRPTFKLAGDKISDEEEKGMIQALKKCREAFRSTIDKEI
jgi:DNA-binding MarR family transcriptional regulator